MFDIIWILIRLGGLLFFLGVIIDIEIILFISGLILLHLNFGLSTILSDYVHINKIKLILLFLIRLSTIEISRYILELLL
uniref:Succinate dehydrogenase subunit 4 n=1 Tax=Hydropuntia rangiferina TaxID=338881 RepID=A0A345UBC2_9FLOR|nr:succinate dehydrogenase subunit 4 [Hydropuntia rangiferina]AXI97758.1 succinate dehydrogenase subunit 4 [Hydropuntia rangiferina]UAD89784.1 succinate dehydrogenase subunit 4 [Hydropuntia rangiferina]